MPINRASQKANFDHVFGGADNVPSEFNPRVPATIQRSADDAIGNTTFTSQFPGRRFEALPELASL
jgi:hypothetical protein